MSALALEGSSLFTRSMTTALLLGKEEGYCSVMNWYFSTSYLLHSPSSQLHKKGDIEGTKQTLSFRLILYNFHPNNPSPLLIFCNTSLLPPLLKNFLNEPLSVHNTCTCMPWLNSLFDKLQLNLNWPTTQTCSYSYLIHQKSVYM